MNKKIVPWLALVGLFLLAFFVLTPFLIPIAWAGILSYASWPIAQRIRTWCNGRDTLAAAIATALVAVTLLLPLVWLVWIAQNEVAQLYPLIKAFLEEPYQTPNFFLQHPWLNQLFGDWLHQLATAASQEDGISSIIKPWLSTNIGSIANVAGGIGKNIAKLVFVLLILFFFYRDGTEIIKQLRYVLAKYIGSQSNQYIHAVGMTTRAVVYGILLTAIMQGLVAGLGYWVSGSSSPVLFGIITAVMALIPFCTPLAWGAAGLLLFLQGNTAGAIGIWIWGAVVVSQLDNILRPIFISSVGRIPFLLVLFGVLGGLLAFGLVGLFIGPIILSILWAVWREWTMTLHEPN